MPGQPSAHIFRVRWPWLRGGDPLDVKHCFQISFDRRPNGGGYFVIGKVAQGTGHSRPQVKSAPMGWSKIVDFVQSSLERFGSRAGVTAERVVKMGEPVPEMPWSTPRECHSFYVGNYDGFMVVAACDAGMYEGRLSDAQFSVWEAFKVWNLQCGHVHSLRISRRLPLP